MDTKEAVKAAFIPILDLKGQYASIKDEIQAAINQVLTDTRFIMGPQVEELERKMAEYCGCAYGVGVNSGTDALYLALWALGVGPGDEVITTPFTFFATTEVVSLLGAKPVFVDIDPGTFNMRVDQVEEKITSRTKAIIPVHLYGQPVDMDPLVEIGKRREIPLVEDCAQAIGARYKGRRVGGFGQAGCFSFFPSKNLGAYGDAGMIVTNDKQLADEARSLRVHGGKVKYYHDILGVNSRLDTMQAAILLVKLRYIDQWNQARRRNAYRYNEMLKGTTAVTPVELKDTEPVYHQYTIRVPGRNQLSEKLKDAGVGTMIYYPVSLHLQKVYRDLGYKPGDFPACEKAQEEVLSLPMFPELTEDQQRHITDQIKALLQ